MRRSTMTVATFASVAALVACQSAETEEEVTLRAGHGNTTDYIYSLVLNDFADDLEERTDERIEIEEYPNAQLGDEAELLGLFSSDDVDLTFALSSNAVPVVPELGMLDSLFLFDSEEHYRSFAESDETHRILNEYIDARGLEFEAACVSLSGVRSVYTNNGEVSSMDDLSGLQIRVPPSPIAGDMWNALGASPTTLPWPDIYNGFSTGLVDAAENGPTSYFDAQHEEVAPHFTDTRHQFAPAIFFVGDETRERVPEDLHDEFDEALDSMCSGWIDQAFNSEAEYLDDIDDVGDLYEPSGELINEMRETVAPLVDDVVGETGTEELYQVIEETR